LVSQFADVVIVGAGPGGTSAGYYLAKTGLKVLLIDKANFPRRKICGDGITRGSLKLVEQMGLSSWLEQSHFFEPTQMRVGSPNGKVTTFKFHKGYQQKYGFGLMIPRLQLDFALLENTIKMGCEYWGGVRVEQIASMKDGVRVRVKSSGGSEELRASSVIIAEGSNGGLLAKQIFSPKKSKQGIALQAYITVKDRYPSNMDIFYVGSIIPGYFWAFPVEENLLNIGIGGFNKRLNAAAYRDLLCHFVKTDSRFKQRAGDIELDTRLIRGGLLNLGFDPHRTFTNRILFVGDAAGLVDPFSGAGIFAALSSGKLAAQSLITAFTCGDLSAKKLSSYGLELARTYQVGFLIKKVIVTCLGNQRAVDGMIGVLLGRGFLGRLARYVMGSEDPPS
jgi:menaquinone-9 beta-reductase